MFKLLLQNFIKVKGRSPNAIEMLQLKFKAASQANKGKVIQFPQKRDFSAEIQAMVDDGTLTIEGQMDKINKASNRIDEIKKEQADMYKPKSDAEIKAKYDKQNKESIQKFKDKMKKDEPEDMATGGRAGFAGGGGLKRIVQEIIEYITTKFTPMDAMKEVNKVISKTGKYKNLKLTDNDINDIVEGSNDFIFQRDPDNLFVEGSIKERTKYFDDADEAGTFFPKTSKDKSIDEMSIEETLERAEGLGATKMAERFKLKQKYPGIDDDLLTKIIEDTDPVHKASVLAKIDMAMELGKTNKSAEEIIDILKKEPETKMATGGRAGYYGGGQATVEPDLSDIGHGSDALMARTRITAPGSQATTSTGLNYLLGEDNDNVRVPFKDGKTYKQKLEEEIKKRLKYKRQGMEFDKPLGPDGTFHSQNPPMRYEVASGGRIPFNEGLSVKPSESMMVDTTTGPFDFYNTDKFEKDSMTLLKGMYGTGKDSNEFLYNEMIKKGNKLREQGVDRETVIEIIRKNKDKIDMILKQQTGDKKSLAGLADGGRAAFGGGGSMGATDRGYQGGGRNKSGGVSGTAPGAAAVGGGPDDKGNPQQNLNHLVSMHQYQNPPESKVNNLINTGQEVNYLRNLYKMDPIGLGISYGINKFGPSIMDKLKNLRNRAEIEEEEDGIMQMADAYNIPTEGSFGLNLMDYNTLKNSGYSDGQIEELQFNPDINTEEVIRDIKGPIFAAAKGGIAGLRQGYVGGGGVNLARRGFLKILGGTVGAIAAFKTGALKMLGKTTTKTVPKLFTATEGSGAPAWFEGMVNKVLADGLDITKKASTMDGQTVKSLDTPTGKVDVTIDRTGNIDVNYMGDNTAMGEGVNMRYVVGQADEGTKGIKPADEFEAVESIPEGRMYGPDDYQVEMGENATDQVKNLYSDVSELQTLGGDTQLVNDISVTLQKKKTLKKMNENPDQFASDNLPDYDY